MAPVVTVSVLCIQSEIMVDFFFFHLSMLKVTLRGKSLGWIGVMSAG